MGVLINGIGIGFFAAFFISSYAEFLFTYKLPFVLIYGIIAPFLAAFAIIVQVAWNKIKKRHDTVEGYNERSESVRARK